MTINRRNRKPLTLVSPGCTVLSSSILFVPSCIVLSCPVLACPIMSGPYLSYHVRSAPVLSCRISSPVFLSRIILFIPFHLSLLFIICSLLLFFHNVIMHFCWFLTSLLLYSDVLSACQGSGFINIGRGNVCTDQDIIRSGYLGCFALLFFIIRKSDPLKVKGQVLTTEM